MENKNKPKKLKSNVLKTNSISNVSIFLERLRRQFPNSHCSLKFNTPFELLVATVLSAQCTDERVNIVTPLLFQRYPTPESMARASLSQLEELVRPTGFYKNKALSLKMASQTLVEQFGGKVPTSIEELIQLRGVGRKTANVVLGSGFGIPSGIVVDTHVGRISKRWRWTKNKDPEKIEQDLLKIVPQKYWVSLSHQMIDLGRSLCKARNPLCTNCFLLDLCPQYKVK